VNEMGPTILWSWNSYVKLETINRRLLLHGACLSLSHVAQWKNDVRANTPCRNETRLVRASTDVFPSPTENRIIWSPLTKLYPWTKQLHRCYPFHFTTSLLFYATDTGSKVNTKRKRR